MKKSLFSLFLLGFVFASVYGQNADLTQEPILSDKQRTWLNSQGVPIGTYNWKQPKINENLNLALRYNKKARGFKTGGWICVGVGAGLVTGLGVYLLEDAADPTGMVLGGLVLGGSIPLFVFGKKNDRKSDTHISKALVDLRDN